MRTARVTLTLDQAALAAARQAAAGTGESLSVWLSHAAWHRAVEQAAVASAEQDRLHPEWAGWDESAAERILGQAAA
ncbi:MAG: hypothetical protein ACRDT2_06250 [Natronosporangium sp.]